MDLSVSSGERSSGSGATSLWNITSASEVPNLHPSLSLKSSHGSKTSSPLMPSSLKHADRWKRVESTQEVIEFGSLDRKYDPLLVLKFYHASEEPFEILTRVGDFEEVPLNEALSCLNSQASLMCSNNVHIEIDVFEAKPILEVKPILLGMMVRHKLASSSNITSRCVFAMYDYQYASVFAELLCSHYNRLFELNIGAPNKLTRLQQPETEAENVLELVTKLLKTEGADGTAFTLRSLRIFPFIKLNAELEKALSQCSFFSHLTLSNIADVQCPEFKTVRSVLLDGCDMANSFIDRDFAKKVLTMFPSAVIFGFMRCEFDPVVTTALRYMSSERPEDKRKSIHFYQTFGDLTKFLAEVTKWFIKVGENREEGLLEIEGHNGGPRVIVHSPNRLYRIPIK